MIIFSYLVFNRIYPLICSPVWSSTSKNISKLQKNLEFCFKPSIIITNTRKFDHITPVLQGLRWVAVSYLMYTVGVLAFKCEKGLIPSCLSDRFETRLLLMIAIREIRTILIFQLSIYGQQVTNELFHTEQLSTTQCHVRSLLQTSAYF